MGEGVAESSIEVRWVGEVGIEDFAMRSELAGRELEESRGRYTQRKMIFRSLLGLVVVEIQG